MKLKKILVALLSLTSAFGWGQPEIRPNAERPPRYPEPGRPSPERPSPRPEPRPEPRPSPRPEPRPEPRPSPRPEPRPPERPTPRPEPRPPERPTPRPEPRPPRPRPPEPRPPRPTPRPEPRPPYYPPERPYPRPEPMPYYEYVTISIERTFYNYDTIRLNDYLNLYNYYGYRVESVEIDAYTYDYSQRISLVVDGQIDGEGYITERDSYAVIYPSRSVRLGTNTYDLSLLLRGSGSIHVNRVILRLSR